MSYYVYMMASKRNDTLYTGMTNDLVRRTFEHREGVANGFISQHGVKNLVWFEEADEARAAIQREKTIKHWSRAWKMSLIESNNPMWRDLYDDITQ